MLLGCGEKGLGAPDVFNILVFWLCYAYLTLSYDEKCKDEIQVCV